MIDAPSGGAPEKAPRWDIVDTKGYSGGIRVLAPYLVVWGYVGIYRRKEYVGGPCKKRSTSVEQRGPHEGGGRAWGGRRAPYLVASLLVS